MRCLSDSTTVNDLYRANNRTKLQNFVITYTEITDILEHQKH